MQPQRTTPLQSPARAACDDYRAALAASLTAARRHDQLGHRLHATESARAVVRLLFALEERPPPEVDALAQALAEIEAVQDWPAGYLRWALLQLLREPAPPRQLELARRVDRVLAMRGLPGIFDELAPPDVPLWTGRRSVKPTTARS